MAQLPLKIALPFPPSINSLYFQGPKHGQKFLSKVGKDYKQRLINLHSNDDLDPITVPIKVRIEMIPPDARTRDIDNYIKPVLDGLKFLELIEDDSLITKMAVIKHSKHVKYNRGMILVYIREDTSESRDTSDKIDEFFKAGNLGQDEMIEFHKATKKELGTVKKYVKKRDRPEVTE